MENQNTKENIGKILDYWYTIDFLEQSDWPSVEEHEDKTEKQKRQLKQEKEKKNQYLTKCVESDGSDIIQTVKEQVSECGMSCWGNITVYLGKISREICLKNLISKLGIEDDSPEKKSFGEIALAAFQVTENGDYVKESFSLSPVLWAVRQIEEQHGNFSGQIRGGAYYADKCNYEHVLAPDQSDKKPYHIELKDIKNLEDAIWKDFVKNIFEEEHQELEKFRIIEYQMFIDEKAKERYESDTYMGLSRNYFTRDLDMLINLNNKNKLNQTMRDYILALHNEYQGEEKKSRIDLLRNANKEEHELQLNKILRMKNSSLGKWPSKYMPAFMQQVAINLLLGDEVWKELGENGTVFSVNGPPGTGKTTMLKEIVVNNIVERAALLAQYESPEDAFTQENFKNGPEKDKSYFEGVNHWYKLKNDSINDYSILVASSNNAAVENISKELPVGKSILDALKPGEASSENAKKSLNEVSDLFDVSKSNDGEKISNKIFPDIYFTKYANDLLGIENAWGLVAAALGKKSNRKKFYDKVFIKLLNDFYKSNSSVEKRLSRYKEACEKFKKQYELVKNLQEKLDGFGELSVNRIIEKRANNKVIMKNELQLEKKEEERFRLETELSGLCIEIKQEEDKLKGIDSEKREEEESVQRLKCECEKLENQLNEIRKSKESVESSIGFFMKFFKTGGYKSKMECIEAYGTKEDSLEHEIIGIQTRKEKSEENLSSITEAYEGKIKKISELNEHKKTKEGKYRDLIDSIGKMTEEISDARQAIAKKHLEYEKEMCVFQKIIGDGSGIILDQDYVQNLFYEEQCISAQAHVGNPWATEQYNREREKLFYYAMKLNKEFVLSSKECRDNFRTLEFYWGYKRRDDKIKLSEGSDCVTALLQTLFLLVPVISSTFASVGSFFKDARQSGVYGLLIVDEAGQAQPHTAAGALYRSRKAMIVGDPKQIEPVITDELNILKETFDEEIYRPYKKKNKSVQLCADLMNPFGTFMDNGSRDPEWIGCPLLVHRRCISPMYDISNELSYNGMMKQQTSPPEQENFIGKSGWIQNEGEIEGKEVGDKNYFVADQAEVVCTMLEIAFGKSENPDIYIISPFTTVVKGLKSYIKSYSGIKKDWKLEDHIGTVHTFQGKEAEEVIFVLGCDKSEKAAGAIRWVNKNIVNVAVTRAKYRLYVIGDKEAWSKSPHLGLVMKYLENNELNPIVSSE